MPGFDLLCSWSCWWCGCCWSLQDHTWGDCSCGCWGSWLLPVPAEVFFSVPTSHIAQQSKQAWFIYVTCQHRTSPNKVQMVANGLSLSTDILSWIMRCFFLVVQRFNDVQWNFEPVTCNALGGGIARRKRKRRRSLRVPHLIRLEGQQRLAFVSLRNMLDLCISFVASGCCILLSLLRGLNDLKVTDFPYALSRF